MESPSLVRNGVVIRLPIGFRFHPTDEELLVHYLKRKVCSSPLPASVIPEFDVFQTSPWDLPGNWEEKRYFFSRREGMKMNKKCNRIPVSSGCGYWKLIGKEKPIVVPGSDKATGIKKTLLFCQGRSLHEPPGNWVMHQYYLVGHLPTPNSTTQNHRMEMEDWVVSCISQKRRKANKTQFSDTIKTLNSGMVRPCTLDLTMEMDSSDLGPPQPSSSCSSGTTQCSANGSDQEASSA